MRNLVLVILLSTPVWASGIVSSGVIVGGVLDSDKKYGGYIEYADSWNYANVHPQVSLYGGESGFCYGSCGLRFQKPIGRFVFALSSNIGLFDMKGYNPLGSNVEFLSYIQLEHNISRRLALSFAFGHISNAHLSSVNPGSELIRIGLTKSI